MCNRIINYLYVEPFYPLNHKRVGVEDLKLNVSNYTRTKKPHEKH